MCPNLYLGNLGISSWYLLLAMGILVPTLLAIYCRPSDFRLTRIEILAAAALLVACGLLGARILFIFLNREAADFSLQSLLSPQGGYAYFGALAGCIVALILYSLSKGMSPLAALDYFTPFMMLSQAFVRLGCLLAGCCYGRPTNLFTGIVFKTVDEMKRHPTQGYEALALFLIYIIGRKVYNKTKETGGLTVATTLALYGFARFFIEYLKVDSQSALFNLSLAQISCLSLAVISIMAGGLILWKK